MGLSFNIHGAGLRIETSSPLLKDLLSSYLEPYAVLSIEEGNSDNFTIQIEEFDGSAKVEIPSGAKRFFNYYGLIEGFEIDSNLYFKGLDSVFELKPQEKLLRVSVSELSLQWPRSFTHVVFTLVLYEVLRYTGIYYVHAASLQDKQGRGWVFPANQSSGKTTICLALIKLGFKCLTDDAILIKRDEGGLKLLAFEREFHVPLHIAQIFKELEPLINEPEYFPNIDKRGLNIDKVYPGVRIMEMGAPKFIVFPEIKDSEQSSVELIPSSEAIKGLIPQSAMVFFSKSEAKRHLDILGEMVSSATCFRLISGKDIYEDPVRGVERAIKLMEELI